MRFYTAIIVFSAILAVATAQQLTPSGMYTIAESDCDINQGGICTSVDYDGVMSFCPGFVETVPPVTIPVTLPPVTLPPVGPITLPPVGPITLPPVGPITLPPVGPITLPPVGPITLPTTKPITLPPITLPTVGPITLPTVGPITLPSVGPITLPSVGPITLPTTKPITIPPITLPTIPPVTLPTIPPVTLPTIPPVTLPPVGPITLPTTKPITIPPITLPTVGPITLPTIPPVGPITLPTTKPVTIPPITLPPVGPVTLPTIPPVGPVTLPPMTPIPAPTTPAVHGPTNCINLYLWEVIEYDSSNNAISDHTFEYFYPVSSYATSYPLLPCVSGSTLFDDTPCVVGTESVYFQYTTTTTTLGSLFSGYGGTLTATISVPETATTIQWQGQNYEVAEDDAVFSLSLSYTFCGSSVFNYCTGNKVGSYVEVSFVVEGVDNELMMLRSSDDTVVGKSGNVGEIENFPKFAATTDSFTSVARDIAVRVDQPEGNSILTYRFTGPFSDAEYDAIVSLPANSAPTAVVSLLLLFIIVLLL